MNKIIHGDCLEKMKDIEDEYIIVTDPPFNIGYHYHNFKDNKKEDVYYSELAIIIKDKPAVIIHYGESLHRLSIELGYVPDKIVSWVYNSNTAKQHRQIAFYKIKPDFKKVGQPYKNPTDKRIAQRIKEGKTARLYDWWNINQVKNVSKDKTEHPCQMPIKIMENIIGILPENKIILDPFAGSGTTGVAAKNLNRQFILIEKEEKYINIIKQRLNQI